MPARKGWEGAQHSQLTLAGVTLPRGQVILNLTVSTWETPGAGGGGHGYRRRWRHGGRREIATSCPFIIPPLDFDSSK